MISFRTAMILYGVLALASLLTLKRDFLFFALLVIGVAAVKSYIHQIRSRIE